MAGDRLRPRKAYRYYMAVTYIVPVDADAPEEAHQEARWAIENDELRDELPRVPADIMIEDVEVISD